VYSLFGIKLSNIIGNNKLLDQWQIMERGLYEHVSYSNSFDLTTTLLHYRRHTRLAVYHVSRELGDQSRIIAFIVQLLYVTII